MALATITIGADAGDFDKDVTSITLDDFLSKNVLRHDLTLEAGNDPDTLEFTEKGTGDTITLTGQFDLKGIKHDDIGQAVVEIDSVSVTHKGAVSFTISGFSMTGADLLTEETFANFLDAQAFKLVGNNHDNELTGGDNDDQLLGNGGSDTLDGGAGKDALIGGAGDDNYYIDGSDKITEAKGKAGGFDTIYSASTVQLEKYDNVEAVSLIGKKDANAYGTDADNTLRGNGHDNILDGAKGADTMIGGDGNDTYFVDDAKDVVVEKGGKADHDAIESSITMNISKLNTIEDVFLIGKDKINATGNSGDNTFGGNGANNTFDGNGGADTFEFQKGGKSDTIADFDAAKGADHDVVDLSDFGGKKMSFASLDIEKEGKSGAAIDFGHGDVLHIHFDQGSSFKDLDARDFQF